MLLLELHPESENHFTLNMLNIIDTKYYSIAYDSIFLDSYANINKYPNVVVRHSRT